MNQRFASASSTSATIFAVSPAREFRTLVELAGHALGVVYARQGRLHLADFVVPAETFAPLVRATEQARASSRCLQQHLAAFHALFVQVVRIAREAGVVQLGTLAIDGTKVKASASKHKAMSYGRMLEQEQRLREQIAALTAQAEAVDALLM